MYGTSRSNSSFVSLCYWCVGFAYFSVLLEVHYSLKNPPGVFSAVRLEL